MKIEASKKMLVIRYNNYNNFNFIKEHTKLIDEKGYVWVYKVGKMIPNSSLESVLDESGKIIFKAPKKDGGNYYLASFQGYSNGIPPIDRNYPEYYSEMLNMELISNLKGTWLKISKIVLLQKEEVEMLYLCKNDKSLVEIVNSTRTSILYVYSSRNAEIGGNRWEY